MDLIKRLRAGPVTLPQARFIQDAAFKLLKDLTDESFKSQLLERKLQIAHGFMELTHAWEVSCCRAKACRVGKSYYRPGKKKPIDSSALSPPAPLPDLVNTSPDSQPGSELFDPVTGLPL